MALWHPTPLPRDLCIFSEKSTANDATDRQSVLVDIFKEQFTATDKQLVLRVVEFFKEKYTASDATDRQADRASVEQ